MTLQKERVEEDGVSEIEFERLLPDGLLIDGMGETDRTQKLRKIIARNITPVRRLLPEASSGRAQMLEGEGVRLRREGQ